MQQDTSAQTQERVTVKIIRSMCDDPKVTDLVTVFDPNAKGLIHRTIYREVFPQQIGEMLNWLTGTQRVVVDFPDPLTKSTPTVAVFRNALYQLVQDMYPGGLSDFLLAFPNE